MADPFDADPTLDLFAALRHVIEQAPSPKVKGRARGLLAAIQREIDHGDT